MSTAYGEPIHHCPVSIDSHWLVYWNKIIQHSGRHYDLPKGSISCKYVSQMIDEIRHFNSGNFPSERFLVFSSVILQRDKMSTKGPEIRKVIDRRLSLWKEEKYDLLVQEATRCDKAIRRRHPNTKVNSHEHRTKVFTRLMLQGKVRAAMRWLTERSGWNVLLPSDLSTTTRFFYSPYRMQSKDNDYNS